MQAWVNKKRIPVYLILIILGSIPMTGLGQSPRPNILLIIADDMGVDVTNGYHTNDVMPSTPTLDSLRKVGITFTNVFSAPVCTPTRAAILSGKYGIKTGVQGVPGNLDLTHTSIFKAIEEASDNAYADAVIGKWHLAQPLDPSHPLDHGADYFAGLLGPAPEDYFAWARTENGVTSTENNYITSDLTDDAISWIDTQNDPWILWLAHAAPHSPFQTPPSHMYTIESTQGMFRKYLAMIEALDYSIDRLLNSLTEEQRENTLVIFFGDNGTPNSHLRDYPDRHGKGSLYQGGIRVPMIISGKGVERKGVREDALIHVADLYATLLELAGGPLPGGVNNSLSFLHLLDKADSPTRSYNYSDLFVDNVEGWAIRNNQYKLIAYANGEQEMYDLFSDSLEFNDLLVGSLTNAELDVKADLEVELASIRNGWSCRDFIKNGNEEGIDCGGDFCNDCITTSLEEIGLPDYLKVFPNPVNDRLEINSTEESIEEVVIYNIAGNRLSYFKDINSHQKIIDVSTIHPQALILSIKTSKSKFRTKVIKR